ncbi:MAG: DUF4118 domain-containing protein [Actinomycetota bacterium]
MDEPVNRGRLQIWLGYAAGVGKTYTMLGVAHRLVERGEDLAVGFVETHGRSRVQVLLEGLEIIPRRKMPYQGAQFEEMDLDAVLARAPRWAVVDELAHTNVPGSKNPKRWQDVEELLDAGISVLTTLNIQHLESLNDTVESITGVKQLEMIPDAAVRAAGQIDLVDVASDALRRRLARGDIYPAEKIDAALANYFREGNLTALRELALLWLADRVDEGLLDYMARHEIRGPWETRERVVVGISAQEFNRHLVRRAARMAARRGGDLLVVHVIPDDGLAGSSGAVIESLAELTRDLGGTFHEVTGNDIAGTVLKFARAENATLIVMGASNRSRLTELVRGSIVNRIVRDSGPIDIHIISHEPSSPETPLPGRRRSALPLRRQLLGAAIGILGFPVLTAVLTRLLRHVGLSSVMLVYLSLVVGVAVIGGWWPAITGAVAAALLINWFFMPPFHTWMIADPEDVVALVVFTLIASVVSALVGRVARNRLEADRSRAEAESLTRLAGSLAQEDDPLQAVVQSLWHTFRLDSVAVLAKERTGWRVEVSAGPSPPATPDAATYTAPLVGGAVLAARGPGLSGDDQRVLSAFVAQISAAVHGRRLAREAATATQLAGLNELRSAILNAVSHDLRSPLSSIKAAVTSLRQTDVTWSDHEEKEFLATIEEEANRLDWLVANLLDMSRLQAGAVALSLQSIGLDEVVPRAIWSLSHTPERIVVDVPETLSRVRADAALLERAVANVIENALAWSPESEVVRVGASEASGRVELRVVDRGPGIPEEDRERVFQPFQRLGDRSREGGVGLGMAVAKGFVEAIGGCIELEDTPGGGLTVAISLEATR